MRIITTFKQENEPVFCDECRRLAKYMHPKEIAELEAEGWLGDWLCDDCWDKCDKGAHSLLVLGPGDTLGFRMDVDGPYEYQAPRANQVTVTVRTSTFIEVKGQ